MTRRGLMGFRGRDYVSTAMKPTLRGEEYRCPAVYDADLEGVFHRRWCYVGRSERLTHVGDRMVVDIGAESVLVLRNRDGDLQAYYNVCRHRGSQLCDASGVVSERRSPVRTTHGAIRWMVSLWRPRTWQRRSLTVRRSHSIGLRWRAGRGCSS